MLTLIITVLAATILCLYLFHVNHKKYNELDILPGPPISELLKYSTYRKSEIFTYLGSLNKRYGKIVKLWIKPFKPTLVVADPKYVERILMSRNHISKPDDIIKHVQPILGDSLFSSLDDELWKRERKIFGYACTPTAIKKDMHLYKTHFDKLDKILKKFLNVSQKIDIYPLLDCYVMDLLFDFLVGEQMNTQDSENIKYVHEFGRVLDVFLEKCSSVILGNNFLFKFSKYHKTWTEGLRYIHNFEDNIIARRLEEFKEKLSEQNEREFMKQLFGNGIQQKRMKYHITTFIAGGHETTSHVLSFTLFEIAKDREIQERIRHEVFTVMGNDKTAELTFEDLQHLVYTECVLKETLRLYPPVRFITRLIKTPVTIDGITIPTGTTIIFSAQSLHENEENYPRPNVFDPDRFLEGTQANVYIPFAAGFRNCIGDKIAMSVMKYTVANLIRNFDLFPEPGAELNVITRGVVVHSTTGAVIRIKKHAL